MCTHSIPIFNNTHYIFDEDQTSWMMLWSKPDSFEEDQDYVIMLDNTNRVVVVPNELFLSSFVEEEDPNLTLNI